MKIDLIAQGVELMDRAIANNNEDSPIFDEALILAQKFYDAEFAGQRTVEQFVLFISACLFLVGLQKELP